MTSRLNKVKVYFFISAGRALLHAIMESQADGGSAFFSMEFSDSLDIVQLCIGEDSQDCMGDTQWVRCKPLSSHFIGQNSGMWLLPTSREAGLWNIQADCHSSVSLLQKYKCFQWKYIVRFPETTAHNLLVYFLNSAFFSMPIISVIVYHNTDTHLCVFYDHKTFMIIKHMICDHMVCIFKLNVLMLYRCNLIFNVILSTGNAAAKKTLCIWSRLQNKRLDRWYSFSWVDVS